MTGRVVLLTAVVAVAGGGTFAAVRYPAPAPPATAAHRITLPTTGVAAVPTCPGPETLVAPPGGQVVPPGGPVAVAGLSQGGPALLADRPVVLGPTGVGVLNLPRTAAGTIALRAADPPAAAPTGPSGGEVPGLSLVQLGLNRSGDLRGLTALVCSTPSTRVWLVGGGTQPGRRGRLLIANPAATPATVDVTVHGPQGVVSAPGGSGVVVPAKGQVALLIDALVPALDAIAVEVRARTGRVVAVLHDAWVRGVIPGGVDDVTAAASAGRTQYVPGVTVAAGAPLPGRPGDPGAVAVRVVNPGTGAAVARVRLIGPAGSLALDHAVVTIGPGAVADVPVTGVPSGAYVAVVESDTPVLAGAVVGRRAVGSGAEAAAGAGAGAVLPAEFGWAPSVEPLTTPAVVALPSLQQDGRRVVVGATLTVAAPGSEADIGVDELDERGGVLRTTTLAVPAGASAVRPLLWAAVGLRVRPLGGPGEPVVAALLLQAADPVGPLISVLPVRPGATGAGARPEILADPRVGLRR
ncbi:MAG TPA: DUF5719 family protein [Kineosporiaceae bacterium]